MFVGEIILLQEKLHIQNRWRYYQIWDETICYFDMAHNRTLHFQEEKTVNGFDNGHSTNRFTVVLDISGTGIVIKN